MNSKDHVQMRSFKKMVRKPRVQEGHMTESAKKILIPVGKFFFFIHYFPF